MNLFWFFLWYSVLQCSDLKHVNSIITWEFWCHAQKRNYHKEMKKMRLQMQHFVTGVEKNTRLICWFMFLLRYPLEFMGLYETIWTLFGIKVEGIAIFGNGPNRADQASNFCMKGIIQALSSYLPFFICFLLSCWQFKMVKVQMNYIHFW